MFSKIRIPIVLIVLALILFKFISGITALNDVKDNGETLLLKLRPVDPRALMMGDYMALAYDSQAFPGSKYDEDSGKLYPQGTVVLKLDEHKVGTFSRLDSSSTLADDEMRVKYALKGGSASFGSARYYFQEGTAEAYETAKYGVFKVSPSGHIILVDLADKDYKIMKPEIKITEP